MKRSFSKCSVIYFVFFLFSFHLKSHTKRFERLKALVTLLNEVALLNKRHNKKRHTYLRECHRRS